MYEYETYDPETGKIQTVYKLEDCLSAIRIRNDSNEKRIKRLEEEIKRLKEDHYKDKELSEMKTNLDNIQKDYYRGFPISEDEQKAINDWKKKHNKKAHGINGHIGNYTYEFVPTSIGIIGTIKCSCGKNFVFQNIT